MSKRDRAIELLLWGATGFTGRLAAEWLAQRYAGERIALGGRSRDKLEKLRDDLVAIDARCASWAVRTADSFDVPALDRLVPEASVVASTVGPFSIHGHELVAACARHGTDYCDITGEVPFARDVIERNEARAKESGARLVPFCGFDSVPSDLGVFELQDFARRETGAPCVRATFVIRARGGFSGGTIATMMEMMDRASKDVRVRHLLANGYALVPEREHDRAPADARGAKKIGDVWTAPFVMGAVNSRVVHRSNALLGDAYGHDFAYTERMVVGRGTRGHARATAISAGFATTERALSLGPARALAKRFVPAPGTGPSKESRDSGSFEITIDGEDARGETVATFTMKGDHDPGYTGAARILVESALCLSRDAGDLAAGVPTPACMGNALATRLRAAGYVVETHAK
jgi:short subunit dehydrogenase-like uncharacterized protein